MKVSTLSLLFDGISGPVASLGSADAAAALARAAAALKPYAETDVEAFALFLAKADEYRRTGEVGVPGPVETSLNDLSRAADGLDSRVKQMVADSGPVEESAKAALEADRKALREEVAKLLKTFGLSATFKEDKKWFDESRRAATVARADAELRDAVAGVSESNDLVDESRAARLEALADSLTPDDIKAFAKAAGVKAGKDKRKVIDAAAEKLTGFKFPKAAKKPKKPAVDLELVNRLADAVRADLDHSWSEEGLSGAAVRSRMDELNEHDAPTLLAVAKEAKVHVEGKSKAAVLQAIELRLTEAERQNARATV